MANPRNQLWQDLVDLSEPYPVGVQAAAFCQLLAATARVERVGADALTQRLQNDFDATTIPVEDRMAWNELDRRDEMVELRKRIQERVARTPPPFSVLLRVLRDCTLRVVKRGAPPDLVFALIYHFMEGRPLTWPPGDPPVGGNDLNGLPAWVRGRKPLSGLAGAARYRDSRRINDEGLTFKEWIDAAGISIADVNDEYHEAWLRGEDPTEYRAGAQRVQGLHVDDDLDGVGRR
jgi:hypothetical protein